MIFMSTVFSLSREREITNIRRSYARAFVARNVMALMLFTVPWIVNFVCGKIN